MLDIDKYRDTAGYEGYGEIQYVKYRRKISQKYTPGEGFSKSQNTGAPAPVTHNDYAHYAL